MALAQESDAYESAHRQIEGLEADVEAARSEVFSAINSATALRHALEHATAARERVSDTLANLGPLRALAGIWEGTGTDEHPVAEGTARNTFFEHYELQPIDRQTNGPQLFYGLRYHTHIVKPGEVETFHDQVGYWLWEPAARVVTLTLGIPRGQVLLAGGFSGVATIKGRGEQTITIPASITLPAIAHAHHDGKESFVASDVDSIGHRIAVLASSLGPGGCT